MAIIDLTDSNKNPKLLNFIDRYCLMASLNLEQYQIKSKESSSLLTDVESQSLKTEIGVVYNLAVQTLEKSNLTPPDLILFVGPGYLDGHATVLNKAGTSFLDLSIIKDHYRNKSFERLLHLTHELIHGVHYGLNPEFDLFNVINKTDHLFYRMISEGLATYISGRILKNSKDKYWFGFIKDDLRNIWLDNCAKHMGEDIQLFKRTSPSEELELKLFSFSGMTSDELSNGRRAYYYGDQIVEKYLKENSILDGLKADKNDWIAYL